MFNNVHTEFILTPLAEVLSDGLNACTPMPEGIENSAWSEYFLQSLFLRMTGAQEQKMKCICWSMATNDYRYRYELLNQKQYGECSEYKDKRDIYRDLTSIIQGFDSSFTPVNILDVVVLPDDRVAAIEDNWKKSVDEKRKKQEKVVIEKAEAKGKSLSQDAKGRLHENIFRAPYPKQDLETLLYKEKKSLFVRGIVSRLIALLEHSPLSAWNQREYLFFKEHYLDVLNEKQLNLTAKEFLGGKLQNDYNRIVFDHRNRTAHNTASYLKDVPTLDTLADSGYVYKNYFFRFAILLLIDEVFVLMFKKYRELSKGRM